MVQKLLLFAPALFLACHPLSVFSPPSPPDLYEQKNAPPPIDIAVDSYGIPFIRANAIESAMYGLGYMHARDRLFQLDVTRRAGLGTLSEIFGDKALPMDEQLRILTYRLDEQIAHLSDREHRLIDAYVNGANESAKAQGRSAEHFLLGTNFDPLKKRDVIAIARLQAWTLAGDLKSELAFLSLMHQKLAFPLINEIVAAVDDRGAAILGTKNLKTSRRIFIQPNYLAENRHFVIPEQPKKVNDFLMLNDGGSNAWTVHRDLSQNNAAMLFNDPHLRHTLPGNFYLASIKTNDMQATGATFVGLPAILVGASQTVAWGATASYTNAQDLVVLNRDSKEKMTYFVDDKQHQLTPWPQKFCVKDKKCVEKNFYTSIFGPVIDHNYHRAIGKDELIAVMWTGFLVEHHNEIASRFLDLAQSKTFAASTAAVSAMTFPGVNLVLAHISGDIAFGYTGLIPKRDPRQNPYLPLDGSESRSLWEGVLSQKEKPLLINPPKKYIVTANQNVTSNMALSVDSFGNLGASPFRALRINQRIENMITQNGLLKLDELASIQLDSSSTEALELAKPLGQICLDSLIDEDKGKAEHAHLIYDFDGNFTTDATGALPFYNLMQTIVADRYQNMLKTETTSHQIDFAIKNALRNELAGKATATFADNRKMGMVAYVGKMCEKSYKSLIKTYSSKPWRWRWGRYHYLQRRGVLGDAPWIGWLFRDKRREVAGVDSAPMAEGGLPVTYGANLRFVAQMSNPPQISAVLNSGNSGLFGNKNALDQTLLWHEGKRILLETDWTRALQNAKTRFELRETQNF